LQFFSLIDCHRLTTFIIEIESIASILACNCLFFIDLDPTFNSPPQSLYKTLFLIPKISYPNQWVWEIKDCGEIVDIIQMDVNINLLLKTWSSFQCQSSFQTLLDSTIAMEVQASRCNNGAHWSWMLIFWCGIGE